VNTILERLEKSRVMTISVIGKRQFRFLENCDGYIFEDLTREEVLQLAEELRGMASE